MAPLAFLLAALHLHGQETKPKPTLWSLRPVVRPDIEAAGRNPIDVLMARKHTQRGLKPAGPADKATLLRRVYLDLTGLPPSPAEVDAFLADKAPDAYSKVVDRLLADPQHGVRYGRHWLDVLGYADVDQNMLAERGIHLWRDWVIRSLNRDLPYDQFVRAQVAGDLSARADDFFATGFLSRAVIRRRTLARMSRSRQSKRFRRHLWRCRRAARSATTICMTRSCSAIITR